LHTLLAHGSDGREVVRRVSDGMPMREPRVSLRLSREVLNRIEVLGAYIGRDRSAFLRLAIAFADAAMTLRDLRETEGAAADDPRVQAVTDDMRALMNALAPPTAPRLSEPIPALLLSSN